MYKIMTEFGKWIREKRLDKEITLRKFAKLINMPSYRWSKIERGYSKFPYVIGNLTDIFQIKIISEVLNLSEEDTKYMEKLIRLHNITYDVILPPDLYSILPTIFCFSYDKSLSEDKLQELIETIKQLYEKE